MKNTIIATVILAACGAASAQVTGNNLLHYIQGSDQQDQAYARAYIRGVADVTQGKEWCAPSGVTVTQIQDLTKELLVSMPAERHNRAYIFVQAVLGSNFPCAKQPTGAQKSF